MRKKHIVIAAILLLFPVSVFAKSLRDLQIRITDKERVSRDCLNTEAGGCYLTGKNIIYIRLDFPKDDFAPAFYHEVGHFVFDGTSMEEYTSIFNPHRLPLLYGNDAELAADTFADFMLDPKSKLRGKRIDDFIIRKLLELK